MADKKLWEVMRDAYAASSGYYITAFEQSALPGPRRQEFEAMLLALAGWLEAVWAAQKPSPPDQGESFLLGMKVAEKIHREGTLNILRAAAAEAEGEA
jgi:hypothetical protein